MIPKEKESLSGTNRKRRWILSILSNTKEILPLFLNKQIHFGTQWNTVEQGYSGMGVTRVKSKV